MLHRLDIFHIVVASANNLSFYNFILYNWFISYAAVHLFFKTDVCLPSPIKIARILHASLKRV